MKTNLKELLEFPTPFTYKVMGLAKPELVDLVVEVVQRHAPGDYSPQVKPYEQFRYCQALRTAFQLVQYASR